MKTSDMAIHIYNSAEEVTNALATWIYDQITASLSKNPRFSFVLSGGNTPKALYQKLASPAYLDRIPWNRLDFFWGDERFVPFGDDRNNARMAYDSLLDHVPVPRNQIHPMKTDISPADSVRQYDQLLKQYLKTNQRKGFDLVLLGMGDDGHTLSLFPGTPVVNENEAWVTEFYLEAQQMHRITLTKVLVNQSAFVAFMAAGTGKAHALHEVLEGDNQPDLYPSQVIKPTTGEIHWFVDKSAASLL
jgi:6-phosphogluconolactonase